jgi:excinuclease ABC subunit C
MRTLFATNEFAGFGANPYAPEDWACERGGQIQADGKAALRRGVKAQTPRQPGVYAMLDAQGGILYVGKAKNLRARLLSYFRKSCTEKRKATRLLRRTQAIVWEFAPHELAALLRELDLIRMHRPRFNVMGQPLLRRRAYVCLGRSPAPYVHITREPPGKGVAWFGPLIARAELYDAVRHLNDLFRLRDCPRQVDMRFADQPRLMEDEPPAPACIRYELGTCLGPCAGLCSAAQYRQRVQALRRFLRCDDLATLEQLRQDMAQAATAMEYERAGVLRDRLQALEWLQQSLVRLRQAREDLSFIYSVSRGEAEQNVWYLVHEGQVRRAIPAPQNKPERLHALQEIQDVYHAPPRVGIPLEVIDHVWVVAAWFRKFPQERQNCLRVEHLVNQLKSKP